MSKQRITVTGVPVDNIDMEEAVLHVEQMIVANQKCAIFAMNPEKVIAARDDPVLFKCLSSAELLIADGIGIILASRLNGISFKERVPGSELMPKLCEMASKSGYGIFLFGAKEEVNAQTAARLVEMFPGLKIAGRQNGYVKQEETPDLIDKINASRADLLFVALGSPKQEYWIYQNRDRLNVTAMQGVGGTFDVISGNVRRAPKFWRAMHLEWLYR